MRQSINIAMYGINVKSEDKKDFQILDKIPKNHLNSSFDLLDALNIIFENYDESNEFYRNKNVDEDNGNRIFLSSFYKLKDFDGRGLYGIVNFGYFGNEREVHDVRKSINSDENRFINENEGVFEPYYFLLLIPKNVKTGILILEQKRGRGIKGIFKSVFLDALVDYPDYANSKILLSRVFPNELKENFYEKGSLKSIKLIKNQIPEDICDELNTTVKNIETIIKIDGHKITPKDYFNKNRDNLLTFYSVDYDVIKVESVYNGKNKVFTLTDPATLIPYIDITNEIKLWNKGNPELNSIHKVAIEHLRINFKEIFEKYR